MGSVGIIYETSLRDCLFKLPKHRKSTDSRIEHTYCDILIHIFPTCRQQRAHKSFAYRRKRVQKYKINLIRKIC